MRTLEKSCGVLQVLYEIHDHKSALEIMYLATELCSETYGLESKMAVGLFSQYGSVSLLSALYMVEDLHALFVLGQMFQKAQQYELAVEVYDLLMSWAPPDDYSQLNVAAACVNKGVALLCLEKTKESILSFEKAISVIRSIDPKHPAMAFAMRNLSAVRFFFFFFFLFKILMEGWPFLFVGGFFS